MTFRAHEFMILTPQHLGDNYRTACAALGLDAHEDGWGLLLAEDSDGNPVTLLTADVAYTQMLADAPAETRSGLTVPEGLFPLMRPGWPTVNVSRDQ
ncbi:hypothetical protein [Planomonospora sp. ID82291]|uniref:hypothetical protein n=1 Tax=Planomonospora sp. ID82291 TaxID=2738136 RepID=UPI0018C377CB|nr:hypothetical protein [Planomonospora sp. ID82291]MBG0818330.1 hypothetical protein [Planomonospora sp. ID82291]